MIYLVFKLFKLVKSYNQIMLNSMITRVAMTKSNSTSWQNPYTGRGINDVMSPEHVPMGTSESLLPGGNNNLKVPSSFPILAPNGILRQGGGKQCCDDAASMTYGWSPDTDFRPARWDQVSLRRFFLFLFPITVALYL